MRREVSGKLELSPQEALLLGNHSFLNLFNVLEMQLAELSHQLPDADLKQFVRFCLNILMHMSESDLNSQLPLMESNCGDLRALVIDLLHKHPQESVLLEGILRIISIGHDRLQELKNDPLKWQSIPRKRFPETLFSFLTATEAVSQRRFHFNFMPEQPSADAYCIDFAIDPAEKPVLSPAILHDTIRDLASNARKYSGPGSTIKISLEPIAERGLRLMVSDNGMGVPEEEIDKVVQFGYRASNALDRRTMGGGFGLTKAYDLCQKSNGRFFIDSELGKGTVIEMTLFPPS